MANVQIQVDHWREPSMGSLESLYALTLYLADFKNRLEAL